MTTTERSLCLAASLAVSPDAHTHPARRRTTHRRCEPIPIAWAPELQLRKHSHLFGAMAIGREAK